MPINDATPCGLRVVLSFSCAKKRIKRTEKSSAFSESLSHAKENRRSAPSSLMPEFTLVEAKNPMPKMLPMMPGVPCEQEELVTGDVT